MNRTVGPLRSAAGKTDVALALVLCVVDGNQPPEAVGSLPERGDEAIRCPVPFPCRHAFKQTPLAFPDDGLRDQLEEPVVEQLERFVRTAQAVREPGAVRCASSDR